MSKAGLQGELRAVLGAGFATEDEECVAKRIAIAAPVRNESREIVAATDITASASTVSVVQLVSGLSAHLTATTDRISARLGYRREDETATSR